MNPPKHTITSPLVDPEVVAALLKVSRNTVLNWARVGSSFSPTFLLSNSTACNPVKKPKEPIHGTTMPKR